MQATRKAAPPRRSGGRGVAALAALGLASVALTGPARAAPPLFPGGTTVTGGTFTGTTNFAPGEGLPAAEATGGTTTITGGTFTGGGASGTVLNFGGLALSVGSGATVIIGGTGPSAGPTFTGGAASGGNNNIGGYGLLVGQGATADIGGGTFLGGAASGGSNLNVNGLGLVVEAADQLNPAGTLDLFGSGFAETGDIVTGTLADGQALDTTFGGTLEFNVGPSPFAPAAVPEPSTLGLFAPAGLGLLGLTLRARKRRRAA